MRELVRLLPCLPATGATAPRELEAGELQARLASSCEASLRTIHLGLASLGQLVARCSMELQDGTISTDAIENLGHLMAELGDLASECMRIAGDCRSRTPAGACLPCAN
ncbi:MAG TPA: hypothetical protein VHL79_24480 [Ramlibacter sp.]|nr:hypothetical protein [Ramlibacter sp.]